VERENRGYMPTDAADDMDFESVQFGFKRIID